MYFKTIITAHSQSKANLFLNTSKKCCFKKLKLNIQSDTSLKVGIRSRLEINEMYTNITYWSINYGT